MKKLTSTLVILISLIAFPVIFSSCVSSNVNDEGQIQTEKEFPEKYYVPENIEWEKLHENAEYFKFKTKKPLCEYHILKVNLEAENLLINVYPKKNEFITKKGESTGWFRGKLTSFFAKDVGAQIAVNLSPFKWQGLFERQNVGILINEGEKLFENNERYAALAFFEAEKGYTAKIYKNQTAESAAEYEKCTYVLGGFPLVLENGSVIDFPGMPRDERTAAGLSENGKTLYLLCINRKPGFKGLTFTESAEILKAAGAHTAMEFDGGDSTSLYIKFKTKKVNIGIRPVGSSMGFTFE